MEDSTMEDISDFYILGQPIKTEIGNCHFIKVKDYPQYFMDIQVVALTKEHLISKYQAINKDGSLDEFLEEMGRISLFEIAHGLPDVNESYVRLFGKLFIEQDVFYRIKDEKSFEYYRQLILKMSCVKEEKINPNPEIQAAIERSKRVKSQDGDKLEFADMVTSVVGYNGLTYADINEFTIYQLYMTFYRISQIKNYDTSTLFATVSSEKVEIENWSKHIDLFEEEKHFMSEGEFKKNAGSAFDE